VKKMLVATVVVGIWLAPTAYAAPQDQPFLSFLAANKVPVDASTAISAAQIACDQIADGEADSMVDAIVTRRFPTVTGNESWIVEGAKQAYCPS
jgi:uncharacterized protein DUF732